MTLKLDSTNMEHFFSCHREGFTLACCNDGYDQCEYGEEQEKENVDTVDYNPNCVDNSPESTCVNGSVCEA